MNTAVEERPVSPVPLSGNRGFHAVIQESEQPYIFVDTCVQVWPDADLANAHRHGVTAIALTSWTPHVPFAKALEGLMYGYLVARKNPNIVIVDQAEDIRRAKRENKLAWILVTQDGDFIQDKLHRIEAFYRLGLRMMIPAYNATNNICGGGLDRGDMGLTRFGELVVDECNRVGLLLDCTHVGRRASLEILERSKQPVVFSHSNAKAVADNPRNIDDEQIKACVATGGVIGAVPYGPIAMKTSSPRRPTLEEFAENIDYFANLIGTTDNIGIGTDFSFGTFPQNHHDADPWGDAYRVGKDEVWGVYNRLPGMTTRTSSPMRYVDGFSSYPEVLNLIDWMQGRGYKDEDVRKILGENYLRVFEQTWK
jgi:membrane dipeptidase